MSAQPPSSPPPAGGYGASAPQAGFGPIPPAAAPSSGASRAVVIVLVILGVVVFVFGTVGVLAIFGVRKYIGAAKQAEVRNSLGHLAKSAAAAYEREETAEASAPVRRLCPSASQAVPADLAQVRGRKYQSSTADWDRDKDRDAGFACLRFEMTSPQYYQYRYESTEASFVAGGRGDLDGDGSPSDFKIRGTVLGTRLQLSPSIEETDPDE